MISCTEFIPAYSEGFKFLEQMGVRKEVEKFWGELSENGTVMMKLDSYPFAEKYGWIQDKFGVSWQLIISEREQKITPCFMFSGDQHKKAPLDDFAKPDAARPEQADALAKDSDHKHSPFGLLSRILAARCV